MPLLVLLRANFERIDYAPDEQLPVNRFGFPLIHAVLNFYKVERVFIARNFSI